MILFIKLFMIYHNHFDVKQQKKYKTLLKPLLFIKRINHIWKLN